MLLGIYNVVHVRLKPLFFRYLMGNMRLSYQQIPFERVSSLIAAIFIFHNRVKSSLPLPNPQPSDHYKFQNDR